MLYHINFDDYSFLGLFDGKIIGFFYPSKLVCAVDH